MVEERAERGARAGPAARCRGGVGRAERPPAQGAPPPVGRSRCRRDRRRRPGGRHDRDGREPAVRHRAAGRLDRPGVRAGPIACPIAGDDGRAQALRTRALRPRVGAHVRGVDDAAGPAGSLIGRPPRRHVHRWRRFDRPDRRRGRPTGPCGRAPRREPRQDRQPGSADDLPADRGRGPRHRGATAERRDQPRHLRRPVRVAGPRLGRRCRDRDGRGHRSRRLAHTRRRLSRHLPGCPWRSATTWGR